ncbi:hypothetical protein PVMG_06320, partial [Plasmodium vivax Mauritania I]
MSVHRINKILLCSKVELKSIGKVEFYARASNRVVSDFRAFFLPMLKYHNFSVEFAFHPADGKEEKVVLWP